jgi:hypothetical protein
LGVESGNYSVPSFEDPHAVSLDAGATDPWEEKAKHTKEVEEVLGD